MGGPAAGGLGGTPTYRPDIDGLRAIAVLPVLLFHAGVRGFSGGFVGVDIFFTISGYLITGILMRDIAHGRHSIGAFYRRRILRIFPALTVMALATTLAAWVWLLPTEIPAFARSLAATAAFGSNVSFYLGTDYFNQGGTSQPLLHTWSLAVEEQWYILWPLVLAGVGARRPGLLRSAAVTVTLVSFAFAVWLLPRDPPATFYLLPARAWELGLGAVLALMPGAARPGWRVEALGAFGLLLIAASVKLYTAETPFPGLAALPPCVGAALLIHSGAVRTRAARLLSLAPLRFVGLISYSLYLWHWPVIVFTTTGLLLPQTPLVTLGVIAVSLVLATLSWRFVERPFRSGVGGWPTRAVLGGGAAAIAGLLGVALFSPAIVAALASYTPAQLAVARTLGFDGDGAYRRGTCFMAGPRSHYDATRCLASDGRRPAILFVGDSQAAQLWPGLSRHRDRYAMLQATATGCVPKYFPKPWHGYCEAVIDGALRDWAPRHRPAAVVMAGRWQWRWLGGLEETLRDPALRGVHPVLIGPMPEYATALPRLLVVADRRRDPGLVARSTTDEPFAVDRELKRIAARTGTPYISLIDLLCTGRTCRTFAAPGVPLQFDVDHLTAAGSAVVVDAILPRIEAAMQAGPGPMRPMPAHP